MIADSISFYRVFGNTMETILYNIIHLVALCNRKYVLA